MMIRKKSVLALTALATTFCMVGFTLASTTDDDSPLHKAMEKVQAKNGFITSNLKTEAKFKKNKKEIAESATALSKLGKEFRDVTEPAKEKKKTQKEWTTLMDAFVKASDEFATEVAKSDMTQTVAKDKYKTVSATCAACHKDFKED